MIIACYAGTFSYYEKNLKDIESLHLSYVIDLCSDGAAYKMIDTDSINADYADSATLQVNPQIALNTFIDLFCFNYDMYPNTQDRDLVSNSYIPNLTVAGFDGYYMAQPAVKSDSNDRTNYGMVFTPKLPYTVKGEDGAYYALNMGASTAIKLNSSGNKGFTRISTSKLPKAENGVELTSYDIRQNIINKVLTDSIGTSINSLNAEESKWKNTFFVPGNLTSFTGVNPVNGPSILALVQNVDLLTGKKANAFSITGSKVTSSRPVVGYTKNDLKLYCYADKLQNDDGSPVYPFLQFDKKEQRYLWWEFPKYKFLACSTKLLDEDIEKLRKDPNYKIPNTISTKIENGKTAHMYMDKNKTEIEKVFNSPKEAAQSGFSYDAEINRSNTDMQTNTSNGDNIANIQNK